MPVPRQIGEMAEQLKLSEDEEIKKAYEQWRSKPYALTVPLRIAALRGSVPPAWLKDFVQAQGRRLKLQVEFRGSLSGIISELASDFRKGHLTPRSIFAADLVTVGDSWLEMAICDRVIEPIKNADQQDWFIRLGDRWKAYLRRNHDGQIDPKGEIWGAPYRWGCMVVAYRKDKFVKHNIPPIKDWDDLWRPELEGKISMVDAPREVVGAVLKFLGKSYNSSFESDIRDERQVVRATFNILQKQVRLFDSAHYLRAFGTGDVWVAVGWSSDVLPAAKRISNAVVVVPKSGTSLWADIWAIPATSSIATDKVGGRIRGPSPIINQWFDFCLRPARATPFQQNVFPGSSPLFLIDKSVDVKNEDDLLPKGPTNAMQTAVVEKGESEFDTNLVAGMPPADILQKCEFLEPLSAKAKLDYEWLLTQRREEEGQGLASSFWQYLKGMRGNFKSAPPRNI
ncbi:uncharacterized protein LOC131034065 isoform X2 [Cryptomeria japonica]|uniref:uncharacterized protein LOC131034065 isoform X2 n=1 Tax=Cryptomeria japonica TaxID=3369 RepID=UPI0027D9FCB6|nr:uncharacterized protein LOC131034065 isoform X2 [Cryptomeria japonica]